MSRRRASAYPRGTRVTIPERVGPHVKLVFATMRALNKVYDDVEEGSGVLRASIKAWRTKNRPSLESLEAVLGYLGFDFVAVPRSKVMPPELVARLKPIADDFGLSMPEITTALIEIVSGLQDRVEANRVETARRGVKNAVRRAHPSDPPPYNWPACGD